MSDNREITDSRYGDDSRYDVKKNDNFFKDTYSVVKGDKHIATHKSRRGAVQRAENLSGDKRP